jgi:hypothetical protein
MVHSKRCLKLENPKMMANAVAVADLKHWNPSASDCSSLKEMFEAGHQS